VGEHRTGELFDIVGDDVVPPVEDGGGASGLEQALGAPGRDADFDAVVGA